MKFKFVIFLLAGVVLWAAAGVASATGLEAAWKNPSEAMKPSCYWYWLQKDVTADGITKDLEAMAKVGIRRAFIGNIYGQGGSQGSVDMFWNVHRT